MSLHTYGSEIKFTKEIVHNAVIIQSFTALETLLRNVNLSVATYRRINTCNIHFEIRIFSSKKPIFAINFNASILKDNSWHTIETDLMLEKDKQYEILISSNGNSGNAITLKYGSKLNKDEIFTMFGHVLYSELSCSFEYEDPCLASKEELKEEIEPNIFRKNVKGYISIIIPVYNSGQYLEPLFKSILAQTYNYYEAIIVDDGSINQKRLIKHIEKNKRLCKDKFTIRTIFLDKNFGACVARNKGAAIAEGEYLFFCDSDVVLDPTIFEKMIQKLHLNDSTMWCYCNFNVGTLTKTFKEFNLEDLRNRNLCSTMSLMKTEVFPGFKEDLKRLQDWDVFLTLAEAGYQGVWINENLFKAVDRPGITKNTISWEDAITDLRIYHPFLGKHV